jgi:hypothetical protein
MQVQDIARIQKYVGMLDSLTMEKIKLLGQDSIVEEAEEMEKQAQQQAMMQQQITGVQNV